MNIGDWHELQVLIAGRKTEFDPEVVQSVSQELYQDGDLLCARTRQKVLAPKAFPSKAALLTYLHASDQRHCEMRNGEILFFLPGNKKILASNGQVLLSKKNIIIAWPEETNRFEYSIWEANPAGTSLLPLYLENQLHTNEKVSHP